MTGCMDGQGVFVQSRTIPPNQNFMLSIYHFDDSGPDRTTQVCEFTNLTNQIAEALASNLHF